MRFRRRAQHDYGEPWDKSDVKALLAYRRKGLDVRTIARKMGRTVGGVRGKLYRLSKVSFVTVDLCDVLPRQSRHDLMNRRSRDAIARREDGQRCAARSVGAHRLDRSSGELDVAIRFAQPLVAQNGPSGLSSLGDAVSHVLLPGAEPKMVRSKARSVIAGVAHIKAQRDRAVDSLVDRSVGASAVARDAIAVTCNAGPLPASAVGASHFRRAASGLGAVSVRHLGSSHVGVGHGPGTFTRRLAHSDFTGTNA